MKRYHYKNILGEFRIYFCNYFVAYIPSHTFRLWYYRNIMKFKIERGASVHLGCKFNCIHNFFLGVNSTINQNCHLDNRGGIFISDNVSISPRCSLLTADHLIDSISFEGRNRPIYIEKYAFLGFGATVLGDVTISSGCVIGACSLIIKSTDTFCFYAGQPGKKIRERVKSLEYKTNYRRLFH